MLLLPNGILSLLPAPKDEGLSRWPSSSRSSRLTKRFGGLVAVNNVSFCGARGGDPVGHRPERRRQVDAVQADLLVPAADRGRGALQGRAHLGPRAAHRGAQGRGAHLPGDDDLQGHDACATTSSSPITCARERASSASIFGSALARADEAAFGRSADEILDFLGLVAGPRRDRRATCRTAICARSASPSASPPTPRSFCSTSPSPA